MNTSVLITLIICLTLVTLSVISQIGAGHKPQEEPTEQEEKDEQKVNISLDRLNDVIKDHKDFLRYNMRDQQELFYRQNRGRF